VVGELIAGSFAFLWPRKREKGNKLFVKGAPENPVLWTGMKGASAESRKKLIRC
jgi:hypothetical protein